MIRKINIKLNAAHPELPLEEAVAFVGAPSAVFITGVPQSSGDWMITALAVSVNYPDGSATTVAATKTGSDMWTATIPATATSGRTVAGFRVLADGTTESGAPVTGYILAFADFSVYSLTPAPSPAPGQTAYTMRYFTAQPQTIKTGDVVKIDGVLNFYDGTQWIPLSFDSSAFENITLSETPTQHELTECVREILLALKGE